MAIFLGEGWDDENAMSVLREEDRVIRVEGRLDEILDETIEESSLTEFVNKSMWENRLVDYRIQEGAGTAYYVADRFAIIKYDLNGDGVTDRELQIALDNADNISPDAYCWLSRPVDEIENLETPTVDSEYVLNQAIKEAIVGNTSILLKIHVRFNI